MGGPFSIPSHYFLPSLVVVLWVLMLYEGVYISLKGFVHFGSDEEVVAFKRR